MSGLFYVIQICYSKGRNPCWTSLALVIPCPELRGGPCPRYRVLKTRPGRQGGQRAEYSKRAARRRSEYDSLRAIASEAAPQKPASEIDNHEIFLAHIAQRASPVGGDIGETRAGGDAVVRQAFRFVVDPPANQADPALVFGYFAHVVLGRMKVADVVRGAASGREAQWYRNSAERPRNVVQACASRTTFAVARPGRAVYAS